MKLSKLHYNYKVTKYDNNKICIHNKLYSQLTDILLDFPELNKKDVLYLSHNNSLVRMKAKYLNMYINKINPIPRYSCEEKEEITKIPEEPTNIITKKSMRYGIDNTNYNEQAK